jgi:hypothetical protein
LLTRNQSWLFFPMLLEGINLRVASARSLLDGTRRRHPRPIEAALLATHAVAATARATTSRIARTRSSRPTPKRFGISARSAGPQPTAAIVTHDGRSSPMQAAHLRLPVRQPQESIG